ncbi:hydrolase [Sansalvadorimonas verongulae]|uniref:hydrolase n=1 Tax=Sansalvadorimonas verongulae TaxID=2172824 RepID=UPI0012BC53A2|nr:hydrolase [Sansalvadorimonas verongulae]MTI13409.1 hydrolase [Sansalvadorimonas verongulae]
MTTTKFSPAPWLSHGHIQTIWSPLFRKQTSPERHRERLSLPEDDFIDLDWFGPEDGHKPLTLLLHGLTGCSQSKYIVGLQHALAEQDMPSVAMNFRGCSGTPNNLPSGYHSGISSDLKLVIDALAHRFPSRTFMAVGYSLGSSVLLKYLAEEGENSRFQSAVTVSVPFELGQCSLRINEGFSRIYRDRFLRDMVAYIDEKKRHFQEQGWDDRLKTLNSLGDLSTIKTFHEYDGRVTAPLHGYDSAEDYYQLCSPRNHLSQITTSTLILHASDDPFLFPHSIPDASELSASTTMELTQGGGHVGFISHNGLKPVYWLEHRIPAFLRNSDG